jgi:superfamily I DNA/RNA helicase
MADFLAAHCEHCRQMNVLDDGGGDSQTYVAAIEAGAVYCGEQSQGSWQCGLCGEWNGAGSQPGAEEEAAPPPASPSRLPNEEQARAIRAPAPLVVLAGPGTGKSFVLEQRVLQLVSTSYRDGSGIVVVTFTRNAAGNLRYRLRKNLGDGVVNNVQISTIASLALQVAGFAAALSGERPPEVIMPEESLELLGELLPDLTPVQAWQHIQGVRRGKPMPPLAHQIAHKYAEALRQMRRVDVEALMEAAMAILKGDQGQAVRQAVNARAILLDEAQDCTQEELDFLLELMIGADFFAVGAPAQSIYAWRGAIKNFAGYLQGIFGGEALTIITLRMNYRNRQAIAAAGHQIVPGYRDSLTEAVAQGGEILVVETFDDGSEASLIARMITETTGEPRSAVLVRAWKQLPEIERALKHRSVNYVVLGSGSFYDNPTVVGILRWVQAAVAVAAGQDPLLDEVLAFPPRNIDLEKLRRDETAIRLSSAAGHPELREVAGLLRRTAAMKPAAAVAAVIHEAGIERWASTQTLDGRKVMRVAENLAEEAAGFDGLEDFIQYMEAMRGREKGARCFITTIHGSKGLEFDHVYIPGFVDGLIPHDKGDIQEEARLAHVALTRAKDRLVILVPGKIGGKAYERSPFLLQFKPTTTRKEV